MISFIKCLFGTIKKSIKTTYIISKFRKANSHNSCSLTGNSIYKFDLNKISIGKGSYGLLDVRMYGGNNEKLVIGNYCSIAAGTKFILGGNHELSNISTYPFKNKCIDSSIIEGTTKGHIVLGDDVWIGSNCLILSGVKIGQGAVIAAGSVVVKDVEPYSVVAGNPAKIIKYRFSDEVIKKLLNIDYSSIQINSKTIEILTNKYNEKTIDNLIKNR